MSNYVKADLQMVLLYNIGIHRYDIIDTKYGFGAAGSTETVKCKDCGITKVRQKN